MPVNEMRQPCRDSRRLIRRAGKTMNTTGRCSNHVPTVSRWCIEAVAAVNDQRSVIAAGELGCEHPVLRGPVREVVMVVRPISQPTFGSFHIGRSRKISIGGLARPWG